MKKKVIIVSISILLLLGIILSINSTPKDKIYLNKNTIKEDNKSIAIYLEQENGKYDKTTTFPIKNSGYTLNISKSVCNGSTSLSWDNEEWGLELENIDREETKCFLYFDKGKTIEEIIPTLNAKTEQPDFSQVATTDEGVYAVSDGMYGETSYYWRGATTTNYVKFAGFCWRIVRINGDKTVRLIYDGTTCHANGTSTAESIAVASTAYNPNYDRSEYVGWTYSTGSQRGTNSSSNIKIQTDEWFTTYITGANTSKISDGKFCNDRDEASGYSWSSQPTSTLYYAAKGRLESAKTPTFNCPSGDVYNMKIGLITADEVAFAGGTYGQANNAYYLYNGQHYWTMSPSHAFGTPRAYMFDVRTSGHLSNYDVNSTTPGLRPVINIKSDILLSGNGTIDSPYEVL